MYLPALPVVVPHHKRQPDTPPTTLFPHVDNKVPLIIGVAFAVLAILALLLGILIKRTCLRRSNSNSGPPPESSPPRPSNAHSDTTEVTLCTRSPIISPKKLPDHVTRPPSVLVAPLASRPPTLPVATATSQRTLTAECSFSWDCIAQRLDEKSHSRPTQPNSVSPAPTLRTLSPLPPSPRTPTSPSSPIRIPSPVSLNGSNRHIYATK